MPTTGMWSHESRGSYMCLDGGAELVLGGSCIEIKNFRVVTASGGQPTDFRVAFDVAVGPNILIVGFGATRAIRVRNPRVVVPPTIPIVQYWHEQRQLDTGTSGVLVACFVENALQEYVRVAGNQLAIAVSAMQQDETQAISPISFQPECWGGKLLQVFPRRGLVVLDEALFPGIEAMVS